MGSPDKTAKLWSLETGQSVKTFLGHQNYVRSVAFSPHGKYLATGSYDQTAKLWSIETDCVECPSHTYPYSLGELLHEGIELEPNDTAAAKLDTARIAERKRQEKTDYDAVIRTWRTTPQYKVEKAMLDSLAEVAEAERLAKRDIVEKLNKQIQNSEDTLEIYKLYCVLIDTLEKRNKVNTSYRVPLAEACGGLSWRALFAKKFKETEKAGRGGLELDASQVYIKTNIGHALLFQGRYDEALKVYQDYANDPPQYDYKTNLDVLLKDFDDLEAGGITHKDIEKVKKALQTKQ